MKNRLNIVFSALVFSFSLFVVVKSFLAKDGVYVGHVQTVQCTQDTKHESTFSYKVELKNGNKFSNRLDIPCGVFSDIKEGDLVELQANGSRLINIKFKGELIFDQKLVELRGSGVIFIFYVLLIISAADIGYRLYSKANK